MTAPKSNSRATTEERMRRAMQAQSVGDLAGAEGLYRSVLEHEPAHPHALHFLGLVRHERGDTAEAIALVERAAARSPNDLDARNNLANLYIFAGRLPAAEAAFRAILERAPEFASARFNLGVLLARSRRFDEAIAELRVAAISAPDAEAYRELAEALAAQKRWEEAVSAYREAIARSPRDPELKKRLARAYFFLVDGFDRSLTDPAVAIVHLERWVALDPQDAIARHTLAAYSGRNVPARCDEDYVRRTFDLFAESFDDVLGKLAYSGVRYSAAALAKALDARGGTALVDLLDLGSGTGALGPLVRPRVSKLVGVDLSPKMVEKTRARGVYDEVEEAEAVDYLRRHPGELDVVVSADTVVYFGDVTALFEAAMKALRPRGRFIFTVEKLEGAGDDATFRLDRHGRYSHAEPYLGRTLTRAGATIEDIERIPAIRVEHGLDVPGMIVTAKAG